MIKRTSFATLLNNVIAPPNRPSPIIITSNLVALSYRPSLGIIIPPSLLILTR
jgi:hypothetical protein